MTDDAYFIATGQRLDELAALAKETAYSEDDLLADLAAHGYAVPPFATRAEPEGYDYETGEGHPGDRVIWNGVQTPAGTFLGIPWSFGEPSEDEMESWKCIWHGCFPLTRDELIEAAKRVRNIDDLNEWLTSRA